MNWMILLSGILIATGLFGTVWAFLAAIRHWKAGGGPGFALLSGLLLILSVAVTSALFLPFDAILQHAGFRLRSWLP